MHKSSSKLRRARGSTKSQVQQTTCPYANCGKSFSEPIKLTVISEGGILETYDACPYCFSQVANVGSSKIEKPSEKDIKTDIALDRGIEKTAEKTDERKAARCSHSFGYLSKRPKGSSIPDECLTCPEITKCLLQ